MVILLKAQGKGDTLRCAILIKNDHTAVAAGRYSRDVITISEPLDQTNSEAQFFILKAPLGQKIP